MSFYNTPSESRDFYVTCRCQKIEPNDFTCKGLSQSAKIPIFRQYTEAIIAKKNSNGLSFS